MGRTAARRRRTVRTCSRPEAEVRSRQRAAPKPTATAIERSIGVEVMSGQSACALVYCSTGVAFVNDLPVRSRPGGGLGSRPRAVVADVQRLCRDERATHHRIWPGCPAPADGVRRLAGI